MVRFLSDAGVSERNLTISRSLSGKDLSYNTLLNLMKRSNNFGCLASVLYTLMTLPSSLFLGANNLICSSFHCTSVSGARRGSLRRKGFLVPFFHYRNFLFGLAPNSSQFPIISTHRQLRLELSHQNGKVKNS